MGSLQFFKWIITSISRIDSITNILLNLICISLSFYKQIFKQSQIILLRVAIMTDFGFMFICSFINIFL
jgi:hypothetical protein